MGPVRGEPRGVLLGVRLVPAGFFEFGVDDVAFAVGAGTGWGRAFGAAVAAGAWGGAAAVAGARKDSNSTAQ